jgi:hypothetical protein
MWTALPVNEDAVGCRPPFSFYFDLVGRYWKSDSNSLPIHRICTLARKQGATFFVLENATSRPPVRVELDALDAAQGGGGAAEAISFSFFSTPGGPVDIAAVDPDHFLGQAVIINYRPSGRTQFSLSYIFEAIFPPPCFRSQEGTPRKLLNNFIYTEEDLVCEVKGRPFDVTGIYYCQQNSFTHVCAHASLRMALTSKENAEVTPDYVNILLGVVPPCDGLAFPQLIRVIEDQGKYAEVIDCQTLSKETYISVLASIVESGSKALLIFSTAHDGGAGSGPLPGQDHVVLVYGHTRHSDEWHPQAIAAYAGPADAPYYPASSWIDHFLIHDDNFGPYYTLSSSALEFKKEVTAHQIVAIRDARIGTPSQFAEANASSQLTNLLPALAPLSSGRWFDYLTARLRKLVLRTILMEKGRYLEHLERVRGHDESRMKPAEVSLFHPLPDRFWMVEFSFPPLFTGNHSKLGEVIVSVGKVATSSADASILALRLPGLILIGDERGMLIPHASSLHSHVEIFRVKPHAEIW